MLELGNFIIPTLIAVAILVVITTAVLFATKVPERWGPAIAILRGTLQLALLSIVLQGVITHPWWVAVALIVMFSVAVSASTRRLGWSPAHLKIVAISMGAGILTTLIVVFASGAIEFEPRYVLAFGGIVIGNAMSISTLAGRRIIINTRSRWAEIEAWLSLGATNRQATADIGRKAIHEAILPSTDQTRTTGLVTLPGAFVGAIFGGLDPWEAGRFQILVLAGIMTSGVICASLVARQLAPRLELVPAEKD